MRKSLTAFQIRKQAICGLIYNVVLMGFYYICKGNWLLLIKFFSGNYKFFFTSNNFQRVNLIFIIINRVYKNQWSFKFINTDSSTKLCAIIIWGSRKFPHFTFNLAVLLTYILIFIYLKKFYWNLQPRLQSSNHYWCIALI